MERRFVMKRFLLGGAVALGLGLAAFGGVAVAQQGGGQGWQGQGGGQGWQGQGGGWGQGYMGGGMGWGGGQWGRFGMMADPARAFAAIDANGDGYIDRGELANMRWRFFSALDANNDGVITRAEAEANIDRWRASARQMWGEGHSGWGGGYGQGRGILTMLSRYDRDGDGRVTRAQFAIDPEPMMRLLDRDGDGRISRAEFDTMVEAMRSMRPNRA
jgi:hypothetical protein